MPFFNERFHFAVLAEIPEQFPLPSLAKDEMAYSQGSNFKGKIASYNAEHSSLGTGVAISLGRRKWRFGISRHHCHLKFQNMHF